MPRLGLKSREELVALGFDPMTVLGIPSFKDGASVEYLQCAGLPGARLLTHHLTASS